MMRAVRRRASGATAHDQAHISRHGMLFTTLDSSLMMVPHSTNGLGSQPRIFEMEDTGETLKTMRQLIVSEQ
jgi:hypothetical protein